MDAKTQPLVAAKSKDKGLVDHRLSTLMIRQVHVTHRNGDISVNLNAVFCGVVLVPHPRPRLQRKSLVIGEIGIPSHEIRESPFCRIPKRLLSVGHRRP